MLYEERFLKQVVSWTSKDIENLLYLFEQF
jgi:hypothetical protein